MSDPPTVTPNGITPEAPPPDPAPVTAATTAPKPRKIFRSSCHCKKHVFTCDLPEVFPVSDCNCSFCQKEGALWVMAGVKSNGLTWEKGSPHSMSTYVPFPKKPGDKDELVSYFCPSCGIMLFANREKDGEDVVPVGVNARALEDLDTWTVGKVERRLNDGKNEGTPYVPKVADDVTFEDVKEDEKVHNCSCHCGAVTFKVKTHPIDEWWTGNECNCSYCSRAGVTWVYPGVGNLKYSAGAITKEELAGTYLFHIKRNLHRFCKICGVNVTETDLNEGDSSPNIRCVDGLDIHKQKLEYSNGKAD
ncbi:hypothetical protein MMC25_006145 [Agyrium rufum]|nr:hypothetical protein [Agyrium rufum]